MSSPLQTLLDAKPLGDDRFEARSIEYLRPRVFGGELLAQVLATAARTVQDHACHAIHVEASVQQQVEGQQRGEEQAELHAGQSTASNRSARDAAENSNQEQSREMTNRQREKTERDQEREAAAKRRGGLERYLVKREVERARERGDGGRGDI